MFLTWLQVLEKFHSLKTRIFSEKCITTGEDKEGSAEAVCDIVTAKSLPQISVVPYTTDPVGTENTRISTQNNNNLHLAQQYSKFPGIKAQATP